MSSIRLRLLLPLLALFGLTWGATAALIGWQTEHEAEEVYDAQLAQAARIVLGLALHEALEWDNPTGDAPSENPMGDEIRELERLFIDHKYAPKLEFQVWHRERLILHSSGMPIDDHTKGAGFDTHTVDGERWRLYTVDAPESHLRVRVAEREAGRRKMIEEITRQVSVPMLIALPLLALISWFGVGRALRPLRVLTVELEGRESDHLEPLPPGGAVPDEVRPLVDALDELFQRLAAAFERERRFTADASHELRTPLASLKTQAQVARRADDPAERRRALDQIVAGCDRAAHLVEQLLTLARIDPSRGGDAPPQRIALRDLLEEGLAQCAPAALEKESELSLSADEAGLMQGHPAALAILIRNLVDNAVRYTPEHGAVEASLHRQGDTLRLRIDDSGPGIPEADRARALERFHRGLGHRAEGCGLGLSIVERISQLHGATLRLEESALGGLRVEVQFSALE